MSGSLLARRAPWLRGNSLLLIVLSSWLASVALLVAQRSPFGDLSGWYSDHLRNSYAVWIFLRRGIEIYALPFGQAALRVPFRHAVPELYSDEYFLYPPGSFLIFLPLSLLGQWLPMTKGTFGLIGIVWIVSLAHAAIYAWWKLFQEARVGAASVLSAFVGLFLLRIAFSGFYDVVWVGAAAMAARASREKRYETAILWCAAAAFVHFRAVVLAPLAVGCLWSLVREAPWAEWRLKKLFLAFLLGLLSLASFVYMTHFRVPPAGALVKLFHNEYGPTLVVVLAAVFATVALRFSGIVSAGTVAIVSAVALVEMPDFRGAWWHGCIAVAPWAAALSSQRSRSFKGVNRFVEANLLFVLCLETLVYRDRHGGALGVGAQFASDYRLDRPHRPDR